MGTFVSGLPSEGFVGGGRRKVRTFDDAISDAERELAEKRRRREIREARRPQKRAHYNAHATTETRQATTRMVGEHDDAEPPTGNYGNKGDGIPTAAFYFKYFFPFNFSGK